MKILQLTALLIIFTTSSFANSKIAIVNGHSFYDEKSGIRKLIKAVEITYICNFDDEVETRIAKLKTKIEELKKSGNSSNNESLELSKLEAAFKDRKEIRVLADKKRWSIIVEPVETEINEKLQLFSVKKDYTILNIAEDRVTDAVLYFDESIDVTKEFIKYCNEEFEKEKTQKQ